MSVLSALPRVTPGFASAVALWAALERTITAIAEPLDTMGCNVSAPVQHQHQGQQLGDGTSGIKTASRAAPLRSDTRCKEVLSVDSALEVRAAPAQAASPAVRGATPACSAPMCVLVVHTASQSTLVLLRRIIYPLRHILTATRMHRKPSAHRVAVPLTSPDDNGRFLVFLRMRRRGGAGGAGHVHSFSNAVLL